MAMAYFSFSFG